MKPTSGTTTSVWMATADVPSEKTLDKDTRTNVCIIGAGIAGLTTAYLLAREGKSVIVLDDGPIGGEDHKTGQQHDGAQRWGKLEQWTRNRFPMVEGIEYRWSGQVMEPIDG